MTRNQEVGYKRDNFHIICCKESIYYWRKLKINKKVGPLKNLLYWGGSPGLVVWEETHVPKVMSSNPGTVYWMDSFSTNLFLVKFVMCD